MVASTGKNCLFTTFVDCDVCRVNNGVVGVVQEGNICHWVGGGVGGGVPGDGRWSGKTSPFAMP